MLSEMLNILNGLLPPRPSPTLPLPGVSIVHLTERAVGLGNRVGLENRGPFGVAVLRSSRYDAIVRFQIWATQLDQVDALMTALQTNLINAKASLRTQGFLRYALMETMPGTFNSTLGIWGKTSDYSVLYEYPLPPDTDGAESLIARVPIHINGEYQEETTVTDSMVRWDNQLAPLLQLRGQSSIQSLAALTFISGTAPDNTVLLTRTCDRATGAPTLYPTLAAFKAAVMGEEPGDRHAQIRFPSLTAFLTAFSPAGSPIALGDWDTDGMPDSYEFRELRFESKIVLPDVSDRLEVALENSPLNDIAVMYLRAT